MASSMTPTRLFDTCVFIHHLRGKSSQASALVREAVSGQSAVAFSILTDAELWAGIQGKPQDHSIRLMLSRMTRLPFTLEVARRAGTLRKIYQSNSLKLPDAIIAATAEIHNLPLYTNNFKDFSPITTITVVPYALNP